MVLILSFSPLLACSGGEEDSSDLPWGPLGDSGSTEDTGDTGGGVDSGETDTGIEAALLVPPVDLWQATSHSIPVARGLAWAFDETFSIEQRARPQLFVRADGVFVMMVGLVSEGTSRFAMTSNDGIVWSRETIPYIEPDLFAPNDCGTQLDDGFMVYQPDGTYTAVVEGVSDPELDGNPEWRKWCRATSTDAEIFAPDLTGYAFEGSAADGGHPADAGTLTLSDYGVLAYHNSRVSGEDGGVRVATAAASDLNFSALSEVDILPAPAVEPSPVYLEEGGVRLYYVRGLDGGIGAVDLADGLTPASDVLALANPDADCTRRFAECFRDPAILRLADDRIAMYFTRVQVEDDGYSYAIQRAWATD